MKLTVLRHWPTWRPWLIGVGAALFAWLIYLTFNSLLRTVRYADVVAQIASVPQSALIWSLVATAISYLALTRYDSSAMEYAGVKVKAGTVLLTSFCAYALGNTIGLGVLTGGVVRMRMYTAAGVDATKVVQAVTFNAAAFGIGMVVLGAAGLVWGADDVATTLGIPAGLLRGGASILLIGVVAFIVLSLRIRELRIVGRWTLRLPPAELTIRQLIISIVDLAAAGAALWFLLPAGVIDLPGFVAFYAIGIAAGVISHVPGGLGVFEAVILLACRDRAPPEQILGALVLYRVVYYLIPLLLAAVLLAIYEVRSGVAAPIARAVATVSPLLLAGLTVIAGVWLLVSGVTPATRDATAMLSVYVPLPVVEASHFLGSIAGLALLIVARGLLHRLDGAWWAAIGLAIVAAILALPKGIALSEAVFLFVLAMLLMASRKEFDRRSALFAHTMERGWLLAILWVVAACVFLLFFVYRDVAYNSELWWRFEINAHAPRSLRALVAVVIAGLVIALWQLMRPPPGAPAPPSKEDLVRAAEIIARQPSADAALALMGDKHLLFSSSGRAFVMYGRQARSWVSLSDPVGDPRDWPELIWRLIELASDHGGRAAFYQVRPQNLSMYLDAGLRMLKLGEYAYVPLETFSLKGPKRANIRQGVNKAEREGLTFEFIPREQVAGVLPELAAISDAWLRDYKTREKGFSLGAFDEDYLLHGPAAVVRASGRIVAFCNVLCSEQKIEASIDLMRHLPDAPNGTMDFLFAKLMLHFQTLGYLRFGLGMAPMSGMASHELAPRWHRFGRLLFDRGERFYNFRGLRSFKEKFDPVWEPRYLAAPGGIAPLLALTDTAALISGGLRGVVAK